ncbi:hypothetical protein [Bacillus weihaiensis]|uniref:hypothetical protein n=1 Tax=Bacillus weihaiensis TaxID=1547283 RepID=UPI002352A81F|nr:hypothetical protein [Bacillus weihaiensis]
MIVEKNNDEMSICNECLDRQMHAEIIIVIGGMNIKLCTYCRKDLMRQLIDKV